MNPGMISTAFAVVEGLINKLKKGSSDPSDDEKAEHAGEQFKLISMTVLDKSGYTRSIKGIEIGEDVLLHLTVVDKREIKFTSFEVIKDSVLELNTDLVTYKLTKR